MKKISLIFIFIIFSFQSLDAKIISLGAYNQGSLRVTIQEYHYAYFYSKIGLDIQKYRGGKYRHLYFSLGVPVFEITGKVPLNYDFYTEAAGTRPGTRPVAIALNFETRQGSIVLGTFLEFQENPEFISFGFSIGKSFGEKRNNNRIKSMNKINKYGTYLAVGSGTVLLLGLISALGSAGGH